MSATEHLHHAATRRVDELYREHVGEVYRYAYAVLGSHADAEDVTQATFMNALRALERGEQPQKPGHWLIVIAHNLVRQRWRQAARRPVEVELEHELAASDPPDEDLPLDDLVRGLQRIPPAQREALVMRELEGRSYTEIAGLLGLSVGALETLLFRARRSLADELENLLTCDRAELALNRQADGTISRKDRRRLQEHLDECPACARLAEAHAKRRRAFRGLAVLPLPVGLTLFHTTSSASAASALTVIQGGAGGAGGVGGVGTSATASAGASSTGLAASTGAVGSVGAASGAATAGGAVGSGLLAGAAAKVAAVVVVGIVGVGGIAGLERLIQDKSASRVAGPLDQRTTSPTGSSEVAGARAGSSGAAAGESSSSESASNGGATKRATVSPDAAASGEAAVGSDPGSRGGSNPTEGGTKQTPTGGGSTPGAGAPTPNDPGSTPDTDTSAGTPTATSGPAAQPTTPAKKAKKKRKKAPPPAAGPKANEKPAKAPAAKANPAATDKTPEAPKTSDDKPKNESSQPASEAPATNTNGNGNASDGGSGAKTETTAPGSDGADKGSAKRDAPS